MVRRSLGFSTLILTALIAACGSDSREEAPPPQDSPDAATSATALSLDPDGTITVAPGEPTVLNVSVEPPGVHVVRFALLGESMDASLDADERVTLPDGTTTVTLTAPAAATTFRMRAAAGQNAIAEVAVSVSFEGFARVLVSPNYKGIRNTPSWTASAVARALCVDLPGQPPQDGPILGSVFEPDGSVVLDGLPVGPNIALTLRSEKSVGGCLDLADLETGETRAVVVKVSDVPVDVAATKLELEMSMTPDGSAAWPQMQAAGEEFLEALLPSEYSEAHALLDAMRDELADPAFDEARAYGGWDSVVGAWFDDGGELLRERVRTWIEAGFAPLITGKSLAGNLAASPASDEHGVLSLESFLGLPIDTASLPSEHVVTLAVDPGDTMIVGGSIAAWPSQLVAAAAHQGVAQEHDSPVEALIEFAACDELPGILEATHPLPASCQTSCIEETCAMAIASMWTRAANASASDFDTIELSFTVSGTATVNGNTVITALDASWVGTQTRNGEEAAVKGQAVGGIEAPHTH